MKQGEKQRGEWTPPKEFSIVFDYYCRLNSKKLKHTVLEDFNAKAATMDLHQFMTFCKNFQLTSKQQKRTDQNVLTQFLCSKNQNNNVAQAQPIRKNDKINSKQAQQKEQSLLNENEQMGEEKRLSITKQNEFAGLDESEKLQQKPQQREVIKPQVFLTEKKLSQIFKKHTSNIAQINFQLFLSIMKIMARLMFKPSEPKPSPKQPKQKQVSTQKPQNKEYLQSLMVFLHLETSDHIIQTFAKINESHGNMEHLSLLRSPIKKIHIKNDPLGKYARKTEQKQNVQIYHSRMILKGEKSLDKLPKLGKLNKKKELKSYLKTQPKTISDESLNLFFQSNKTQLQQLNRSLLAKSIEPSASLISFQKQGELLSPNLCKSPKKYTEMHRQKVMCEIKNRQIANLIDSSTLYDDDIFNKYIQLNHKQPKKQIHLKQPKW